MQDTDIGPKKTARYEQWPQDDCEIQVLSPEKGARCGHWPKLDLFRSPMLTWQHLFRDSSLTRLSRGRRSSWRKRHGGRQSLDLFYRFQEDTIDIREHTEAICAFFVWLGLEQRAPPRHEDHEGINSRRSPKLNARDSARGTYLSPPSHDLTTEGMGLEIVSLSIVVPVLIENSDNCWAFGDREPYWGLGIISAL